MSTEPVSIASTPEVEQDTPASRFPVAEFRRRMEARELDEVLELFTDDCVARPLGTDEIEFRGKDKVKVLWNAVLDAGKFTYTEQYQSDDTIVILFNIRYALGEFEAVDVLRINEDGKCREIYAMARPYQPITLFTGRVAMAFARQGGGLINRFLTGLLVWPLEIMQRVGEPVGVWLVKGAMLRAVERKGATR
jgi:SnoaL-like domain